MCLMSIPGSLGLSRVMVFFSHKKDSHFQHMFFIGNVANRVGLIFLVCCLPPGLFVRDRKRWI